MKMTKDQKAVTRILAQNTKKLKGFGEIVIHGSFLDKEYNQAKGSDIDLILIFDTLLSARSRYNAIIDYISSKKTIEQRLNTHYGRQHRKGFVSSNFITEYELRHDIIKDIHHSFTQNKNKQFFSVRTSRPVVFEKENEPVNPTGIVAAAIQLVQEKRKQFVKYNSAKYIGNMRPIRSVCSDAYKEIGREFEKLVTDPDNPGMNRDLGFDKLKQYVKGKGDQDLYERLNSFTGRPKSPISVDDQMLIWEYFAEQAIECLNQNIQSYKTKHVLDAYQLNKTEYDRLNNMIFGDKTNDISQNLKTDLFQIDMNNGSEKNSEISKISDLTVLLRKIGDTRESGNPVRILLLALLKETVDQEDREWILSMIGDVSALKMDIDQALGIFCQSDLILNPYLISQGFVGRETELSALSTWLFNDRNDDRLLCITDFGGAGKTALVWHFLQQNEIRKWRFENKCQLFWSTFYARDYDSLEFLKRLALHLQIAGVDENGVPPGADSSNGNAFFAAWQGVIKSICDVLDRDDKNRWLIVIDGMEREMGAYARPENQIFDSETQDTNKEKIEKILKNQMTHSCLNERSASDNDEYNSILKNEEYEIRSSVFVEFLRYATKTKARFIVTSRLFPIDFRGPAGGLPGFKEFPFVPLERNQATKLWESVDGKADLSSHSFFFESVGNHVQLIVIVAAAFKVSDTYNFDEWVNDSTHSDIINSIKKSELFTARRHLWLELATRDLRVNGPLWGLLCRIAYETKETSIHQLVSSYQIHAGNQCGSYETLLSQTIMALNKLSDRRLIGFDSNRGVVDIHPVVRCHVYKYIVDLFNNNSQKAEIEERIRSELSGIASQSGALIGLLDTRNYEAAIKKIESANLDGLVDLRSGYQTSLKDIFSKFYPLKSDGTPDYTNLPLCRSRKQQALIAKLTGHLQTHLGRWSDSFHSYELSEAAYRLAGDIESVQECQKSRSWQQLYSGSLFDYESFFISRLNGELSSSQFSDRFWFSICLSIRQHSQSAFLLNKLGQGATRWEKQTLAECWYYLGDSNKACDLIDSIQSLNETTTMPQILWERLTFALALLDKNMIDEARPEFTYVYEKACKLNDAVILTFAMSGLVAYRASWISRECENKSGFQGSTQFIDTCSQGLKIYDRYTRRDPTNQFQIPAVTAHLAAAKIHFAKGDTNECYKLTALAMKVASGSDLGFGYSKGVHAAVSMLQTLKMKQPSGIPQNTNKRIKDHESKVKRMVENLLA